jgi:hypothetical protein
MSLPESAKTDAYNGFTRVAAKACNDKPGTAYHFFGPGISNEAHEPLLQLFTVCLTFLPLVEESTLIELKTRSTSEELHSGHFILTASSSFLSLRSSNILPHLRQRNS